MNPFLEASYWLGVWENWRGFLAIYLALLIVGGIAAAIGLTWSYASWWHDAKAWWRRRWPAPVVIVRVLR